MKYLIVFEKWYNRWLRLLTMLLPGRIYIALGTWHYRDFRSIFLGNIDEDQKATFRTKTLRFLRVIRFNWLAKIELSGTRRPWSSIL